MGERFRNFTLKLVRVIQKALITSGLFVLYVVGIGLTRLVATLFNRKLLGLRRGGWVEVREVEPSLHRCRRQS